MKIDVSSVALAIISGCMILGSCVYNASLTIKSGMESVANSLDRVARSAK